MCQFSNIKSHPDIPLENHLSQVAEIAIDILENKNMDFSKLGIPKIHIKELIKRTAFLHDIGKATQYFQNRLLTKKKSPNGEHQHTGLSAILAYQPIIDYCRKNNLENHFALAPLIAIHCHHSSFSKDTPNDNVMNLRIKSFYKEIIELPEFKEIGLSINNYPPNLSDVNCNIEDLIFELNKCSSEQKINFRLLTLFIYSLLLEADKAYLAVKDKNLYHRNSINIDKNIVDKFKIKEFNNRTEKIDQEREKAYLEVDNELKIIDLNNHIYSLTLPTGLGKTLLAASWGLKMREQINEKFSFRPQVIVALPFLSIIDQTAKIYEKFLGNPEEDIFLKTHSLSPFEFKGYEQDTAEFFINIWNSQIIMTTFDQLLYTFLSLKPKHLMRFHNLTNSIIIMDEIQALPPHLWDPFNTFIKYITEIGNSYLLVMSATQPRFLDNAIELIPDKKIGDVIKGPERYFEKLTRYKLKLKYRVPKAIDDFIEDMKNQLKIIEENKIMIVLNTRDSAKKVYESLKDHCDGRKTYFLSSYVIPKQRLEKINQIKNSDRSLVITTQCIEAGVDIDMDYVIRDLAPLDSIIQVAGRCNREGKKNTKLVEIIRLYDPNAKSPFSPNGEFNEMVYDQLSIGATVKILDEILEKEGSEILENRVFDLAKDYFIELRRKDLGKSRTECLMNFSHKYLKNGKLVDFNIHNELRGNLKQYNLIVERYEPDLRYEIEQIFDEKIDRWDRRRKLKKISNKIAMNSISVNAYKFNPDEIATKGKGDFYFLDSKYYDEEFGFNYTSPPSSYII
jgi:CRISPR-associated endonuclease/helicase Cas3